MGAEYRDGISRVQRGKIAAAAVRLGEVSGVNRIDVDALPPVSGSLRHTRSVARSNADGQRQGADLPSSIRLYVRVRRRADLFASLRLPSVIGQIRLQRCRHHASKARVFAFVPFGRFREPIDTLDQFAELFIVGFAGLQKIFQTLID